MNTAAPFFRPLQLAEHAVTQGLQTPPTGAEQSARAKVTFVSIVISTTGGL